MSSTAPFVVFGDEWGIHPTSTQHIIRRLAGMHPLLYVNTVGLRPPHWSWYDVKRTCGKLRHWLTAEGNGKVQNVPDMHLFSPFSLPLNNIGVIQRWNKKRLTAGLRQQLRVLGFDAPVLFVSSPTGAEVVGAIGERLLIYYVSDEYAALPGVFRDYIRSLESILLDEADLIFASSVELQRTKKGKKWPTILLPHGVDFDHFYRAARAPGPVPEELRNLPRPLVGLYGLLAPWVDMDLIEHVARAFPKASVVLVGPKWGDFQVPLREPNLYWLGPRPYMELPRFAAHFNVGLIPFKQNQLTASVNPLKLLEYLALGLPVVSTPLPDLPRFADAVYTAATPGEFVDQIKRALAEDSLEKRERRYALAVGESWDARAATVQKHVAEALRRRKVA